MAKYKYTKEEDNIIRRINRFLERSETAFGVGSEFVDKQKTMMYNWLAKGRTAEEAFSMKNGRTLLSRSTKNPLKYTKEELLSFEKELRKKFDIAKERQRLYDYYKETTGKAPTKSQIRKTAQFLYSKIVTFDQAMAYLYRVKDDEPDATKLINEAKKKGKKSKFEIDEIINGAEEIRLRRGAEDERGKIEEDEKYKYRKDPFAKAETTETKKEIPPESNPKTELISDYINEDGDVVSKILGTPTGLPW